MTTIWNQDRTAASTEQPVLAFAIHCGHDLRADVAQHMALSEADRLREEDPFTDEWTAVAPTRVTGVMSRFQIDLNRPREQAVYRTPDDAWGLTVWNSELPEAVASRSLREYDAFYRGVHDLFAEMQDRFGRFVVLDLHSYNHRRAGPKAEAADPAENPQVNLGTGSLDRSRWGAVADRLVTDLGKAPFPDGQLDVRENVKFRGGHFSRWAHATFPESACVLAIEFKKFFMDEWTGTPDRRMIRGIHTALASTVPGLIEELHRMTP